MAQPVIIGAMVEATRKCRVLPRSSGLRLGALAMQHGVTSLADLRRWLEAGQGMSSELATSILALLPGPEMRPFGTYVPLAHLADGGMGSVWLAASPDQQLVVVKTLKNDLGAAPNEKLVSELGKRFEREAHITQQLNHPNIVRCIDFGQATDGSLFMVLEYVDSGDLRDVVQARSGLSEALSLAILYQVVDGLAEAHRFKLVHRDIKPPNIFVDGDGTAKLADFGIARSTESQRTMLTMQGAIVGSPLYMSPEQVISDPSLDIRADIYALGAVLYFCLAACPPYDGKVQTILHQHCTAPIPDIRAKRPRISERTVRIIATAMAKGRADRFAEPAAMRAAIAEALAALGEQSHRRQDESTVAASASDFQPPTAALPFALADDRTMAADLNLPAITDQATITMDLRNSGDATITMDLRGDCMDAVAAPSISTQITALPSAPTAAAGAPTVVRSADEASSTVLPDFDTIRTLTHRLLTSEVADDLADAFAQASGRLEPGTQATVVQQNFGGAILGDTAVPTVAPLATRRDACVDNLDGATTAEWIALLPSGADDPALVMLFARPALLLGKLREPPVDVCVRNYPLSVHKDACLRISRSHARVQYDHAQRQCVLEDLKAPNGTMLDGLVVPPGNRIPLGSDGDNILILSDVVRLWVRCHPRRGAVVMIPGLPGSASDAGVGLEHDGAYDAITLTRPDNRPELAYAMVLRRLTIGGPGSELVIAGARTRSAIEVCRHSGRWLWRAAGPTHAWQPLRLDDSIECGGKAFRVVLGDYAQF